MRKIIPMCALLVSLNFMTACFAVRSGQYIPDRGLKRQMYSDKKNKVPYFSSINLEWENYPYALETDGIGEGKIDQEAASIYVPAPKSVKVGKANEEYERMYKRINKVMERSGIYDKTKGAGNELNIKLVSINYWRHYSDIIDTYLTNTGFIFLIPSSLPTAFTMTADFNTSSGPGKVEISGVNKTVFWLPCAVLWPFAAPSNKENSLIDGMSTVLATEIYAKLNNSAKTLPKEPLK